MLDFRRLLAALAVVGTGAMVAACQEDLAGGSTCPVTCPEQVLDVINTTLDPVALDTTLVGYPPLGGEPQLLLAYRGDSLQTAAVARFDTLPDRVTRITDTAAQHLVSIDTANVIITVSDTATRPAPVTFEVYDVDTDAADLDTAAVRALFRADRLLGTRTVPKDSVRGEVSVPLPKDFLLPRVKSFSRVRLGVAIRSDQAVQFLVGANESGTPIFIRYLARAATDTQTLAVEPRSKSGTQPTTSFGDLADYLLVLRGGRAAPDPTLLAIGGLPGSRAYLRFELPAAIVESTTVVRATLVLTQRPNRAVAAADSVTIQPRLVRATNVLDAEPAKAALVLGPVELLAGVRLTPGDSGQRRIEIPNALRVWHQEDDSRIPRAVVLHVQGEGALPQLVYFFSTEAAADLRPRLELSYIPRAGFGLP